MESVHIGAAGGAELDEEVAPPASREVRARLVPCARRHRAWVPGCPFEAGEGDDDDGFQGGDDAAGEEAGGAAAGEDTGDDEGDSLFSSDLV